MFIPLRLARSLKHEDSTMKRKFRHRSAKTGRFVTAAYAVSHPKTTVREKV